MRHLTDEDVARIVDSVQGGRTPAGQDPVEHALQRARELVPDAFTEDEADQS